MLYSYCRALLISFLRRIRTLYVVWFFAWTEMHRHAHREGVSGARRRREGHLSVPRLNCYCLARDAFARIDLSHSRCFGIILLCRNCSFLQNWNIKLDCLAYFALVYSFVESSHCIYFTIGFWSHIISSKHYEELLLYTYCICGSTALPSRNKLCCISWSF